MQLCLVSGDRVENLTRTSTVLASEDRGANYAHDAFFRDCNTVERCMCVWDPLTHYGARYDRSGAALVDIWLLCRKSTLTHPPRS